MTRRRTDEYRRLLRDRLLLTTEGLDLALDENASVDNHDDLDDVLLGLHRCAAQSMQEVWVELWAQEDSNEPDDARAWFCGWHLATPDTPYHLHGVVICYCPFCGVHIDQIRRAAS